MSKAGESLVSEATRLWFRGGVKVQGAGFWFWDGLVASRHRLGLVHDCRALARCWNGRTNPEPWTRNLEPEP